MKGFTEAPSVVWAVVNYNDSPPLIETVFDTRKEAREYTQQLPKVLRVHRYVKEDIR